MFFLWRAEAARKQMLNGLSDAHLGNCGGWAANCRSMCLHVVVDNAAQCLSVMTPDIRNNLQDIRSTFF